MFHNLAVPVLQLFIWIVTFLSLYVDELNDDDDDDDSVLSAAVRRCTLVWGQTRLLQYETWVMEWTRSSWRCRLSIQMADVGPGCKLVTAQPILAITRLSYRSVSLLPRSLLARRWTSPSNPEICKSRFMRTFMRDDNSNDDSDCGCGGYLWVVAAAHLQRTLHSTNVAARRRQPLPPASPPAPIRPPCRDKLGPYGSLTASSVALKLCRM